LPAFLQAAFVVGSSPATAGLIKASENQRRRSVEIRVLIDTLRERLGALSKKQKPAWLKPTIGSGDPRVTP
jgi:hypothetical protein